MPPCRKIRLTYLYWFLLACPGPGGVGPRHEAMTPNFSNLSPSIQFHRSELDACSILKPALLCTQARLRSLTACHRSPKLAGHSSPRTQAAWPTPSCSTPSTPTPTPAIASFLTSCCLFSGSKQIFWNQPQACFSSSPSDREDGPESTGPLP